MFKYLLLSILVISCQRETLQPPKKESLLEQHTKLKIKYMKLMQYHLTENSMLNLADPVEKGLSEIHIDLAKEYSKLYLREDGIIAILKEEEKKMIESELLILSNAYREVKTRIENNDPDSDALKERLQVIKDKIVEYTIEYNHSDFLNDQKLFIAFDQNSLLTFKLPAPITEDQKKFFVNVHLVLNASWFLKLTLVIEAIFVQVSRFLLNRGESNKLP